MKPLGEIDKFSNGMYPSPKHNCPRTIDLTHCYVGTFLGQNRHRKLIRSAPRRRGGTLAVDNTSRNIYNKALSSFANLHSSGVVVIQDKQSNHRRMNKVQCSPVQSRNRPRLLPSFIHFIGIGTILESFLRSEHSSINRASVRDKKSQRTASTLDDRAPSASPPK
jgi:hypothetical protein